MKKLKWMPQIVLFGVLTASTWSIADFENFQVSLDKSLISGPTYCEDCSIGNARGTLANPIQQNQFSFSDVQASLGRLDLGNSFQDAVVNSSIEGRALQLPLNRFDLQMANYNAMAQKQYNLNNDFINFSQLPQVGKPFGQSFAPKGLWDTYSDSSSQFIPNWQLSFPSLGSSAFSNAPQTGFFSSLGGGSI